MVVNAQTRYKVSELAMDAAIELERIKSAKSGNIDVIDNFLSALREQWQPNSNKSILKDRTLYPVYSFALSKSGDCDFTPVDDIGNKINLILSEKLDRGSDTSKIDYLRNFCLAVHEALITDLMGQRISAKKNDDRVR